MNPISSYNPIVPLPQPGSTGAASSGGAEGKSFQDLFLEGIRQVNTAQQQAEHASQQLMTGGDVNMAEVLTSIRKADLSFQLMQSIRNKLIQAYQEIRDIRI